MAPWTALWERNFFADAVPALGVWMANEYVRGAVTGVGVVTAMTVDGAVVQLLAPLTPESTIAKFIDRSGPGLQQLAFRVTDVGQVADVLRSRSLRLLYDEPRRGTADSRVNFVHPKDAGGVLVELVQPAGSHA